MASQLNKESDALDKQLKAIELCVSGLDKVIPPSIRDQIRREVEAELGPSICPLGIRLIFKTNPWTFSLSLIYESVSICHLCHRSLLSPMHSSHLSHYMLI